tara:strand:+ start:1942 stop:2283 length:342 start_codon:yes stop_codon:yes gene_type:complete
VDGPLRLQRIPDRRRDVRWSRLELPWLRELQFRPGFNAALVNLSFRGALVETSTRLRPGARAVLRLTSTARVWTVSGAVSRSWVAAVERERGVVYRGAVQFDNALDLPGTGTD